MFKKLQIVLGVLIIGASALLGWQLSKPKVQLANQPSQVSTHSGTSLTNVLIPPSTPDPNPQNTPTPSAPIPPAVTINDFSASASSIASGQSVILFWNTSNASSISITPGDFNSIQPSGNFSVKPDATTTYTLHAVGMNGTATATTTVTVNSTPPPPTGGGPKIPANAAVIQNIDQFSSGWTHCSNSACAGGRGNLTFCSACTAAFYFMQQGQKSPAENGLSTKFTVGSGAIYSNALFANKVSSDSSATNLVHAFSFFGNPSSVRAQALEFDLIQVAGGRKFNWGSQCDVVSGVWDVWNEQAQHWVPTSISCAGFSANTWHHVEWQVQRVGNTAHYVSLTVDGKTTPISASIANQPSVPTNWQPGVQVQFQEDEDSQGIGYAIWMDNWKVAMW